MRDVLFALIAVASLAGCNPSGQSGAGSAERAAANSGAAGFPGASAVPYRSEATLTDPDTGRTTQIVQYHDGAKMRMEMGEVTILVNNATQEAYSIAKAGGRQVAMRVPLGQQELPTDLWGQHDPSAVTRVGACAGAGEDGDEWEHVDPDNGKRSTGCVTQDGILLRATSAGNIVWETTTVERGAQAADLFVLPEGVQVLDLGNIPGMAEALERAGGQ